MNKWIYLFRSLEGENNGGGGLEDIVSEAMNDTPDNGGAGDNAAAAAGSDNQPDPGKSAVSKWDGVDRRKQAQEDPDYELDFEVESGKGKHKAKLSELKTNAKWLFENRGPIASAMKVRELAGKHPEFANVLNGILSKAFNDKGEMNKEFLGNVFNSFEAKAKQQEAINDKIEEKDANIEQMEKLLEDLEADSPQAQILKQSIANQKSLRSQLITKSKEMTDMLNKFNDRLAGIEKSSGDFMKKHQDEQQSAEVKAAVELFNKTFSESTDQSKADALNFIDAEEKTIFEGEVRNIVANSSDKIKDDAGYVKVIQDAVKTVQEKYKKRREAIINDYLRKKKTRDDTPKPKEKNQPVGDIGDELSSLISEATEEHLAVKK